MTDLSLFFAALSRPPEDPKSLHPSLLNAIYLATCWIVGGELDSLKPHFLEQTRHYVGKAIATGDRLMHSFWAQLILGNVLAIEGRMNEAYVTVSSCVEFALACGLDVVHYRYRTPPAQNPLLPPPLDQDEAMDRLRFSSVLYLLDRMLAIVGGTPSAFSGDKGPQTRPSAGSESDAHAWKTGSVDIEVR